MMKWMMIKMIETIVAQCQRECGSYNTQAHCSRSLLDYQYLNVFNQMIRNSNTLINRMI